MKTAWKVALGVGGALALGTAAAMVWTYEKAFRPQNEQERIPENLPEMEQVDQHRDEILANMKAFSKHPYEDVFIESFDGLCLHARFYAGNEDAPVVIAFHGFRSVASRDFSGGMNYYYEHGLNLLLVDHRSHGLSQGRSITFGVKERYDCLAWANYADERFGGKKKILLTGISMGAATVLMASELDLPLRVVGIIADCPYSAPADILLKVGKDLKVPDAPSRFLLQSSARMLAGFDMFESSAKAAVASTKAPILLIHGEDDDFVPASMSEEIAKSAKEGMVEFHTFPGAAHAFSFLSDKERYRSLIQSFFLRVADFDLEASIRKEPEAKKE